MTKLRRLIFLLLGALAISLTLLGLFIFPSALIYVGPLLFLLWAGIVCLGMAIAPWNDEP